MTGIEMARIKRENAILGIANCLPMPFPKLRAKIAGFNRGLNVCVSASSGVGKTTLSKFLLISFVDWAIEKNIDLHILMYLLEESVETFESTILISKLNTTYGTRISLDDFNSNVVALPAEILKLLEEIEKNYMPKFRSYVKAIDTLSRPTEIFMDAKSYIKERGTVEEEKNERTGKTYEKSFTPDNPDSFFVIFLDNLNEFDGEQGADLAGTMKIWSNYALKELCKRYNYTIFNVHQQSADMEGTDNVKLGKLKPSLNGLGDNKRVGRAYRLCLGLFSPYRNELAQHNGYQITGETGYKDYFRSLNIFKNNFGVSNIEVPLYFDGQVLELKEATSFTLKNKPK